MGNLHNPQRETIESLVWRSCGGNLGTVQPEFWPSEQPSGNWRFFFDDERELYLPGISRTTVFRPATREPVAVFMVCKGEVHSVAVSTEDVRMCRFAVIVYTDERDDRQGKPWGQWRCKVALLQPATVSPDRTIFRTTGWSANYNPIIGGQ